MQAYMHVLLNIRYGIFLIMGLQDLDHQPYPVQVYIDSFVDRV